MGIDNGYSNRERVVELSGLQAGPTSIILVGVHGNEQCGVKAVEELLPTLQIERGRVIIAYGNPKAIEQNVRFTETNLNRMFKIDETLTLSEKESYEYGRAQYLKRYLDQADALLDVHASTILESPRFAICEANASELVQSIPLGLVVSGFDRVQPGGTDYYMNNTGKIGICVECGYLGDLLSATLAKQSILAFLRARDHIGGSTERTAQAYVRVYDMYLTQTDDFKLSKTFYNFEPVSCGQRIGRDGDKEVRADRDSVILFAHNGTKVGDEAFLLGEYID